jgi:hypothetical protein
MLILSKIFLEKLAEHLPEIQINTGSHLDPIIVMDGGFGKLSKLNAYPIVPSSTVLQFAEKLTNAGSNAAEVDHL